MCLPGLKRWKNEHHISKTPLQLELWIYFRYSQSDAYAWYLKVKVRYRLGSYRLNFHQFWWFFFFFFLPTSIVTETLFFLSPSPSDCGSKTEWLVVQPLALWELRSYTQENHFVGANYSNVVEFWNWQYIRGFQITKCSWMWSCPICDDFQTNHSSGVWD